MEGMRTGIFVSLMLITWGSSSARGSETYAAPSFRKLLYSARIVLADDGVAQTLRFRLGTVVSPEGGAPEIMAEISGPNGETRAVCAHVGRNSRSLSQISMRCEGPMFPRAAFTTFQLSRRIQTPST